MKKITIKSDDILSSMRMDGSFHLSDSVLFEKAIKKMSSKSLSFYAERIFTAGRNKRVYTIKDFGYPYLSNSDVISQNPFTNCKYNSRKYGDDSNAFLKEGTIVTGRVGAIGQTAYITKEFEQKQAMGSDNIIRIITKDNNVSGFIYAYLASKIGNTFLWKHATGGVQPYINEEMVGSIPVPTFPSEKQQQIHQLISEVAKLRVETNELLSRAERALIKTAGLPQLQTSDYNYFGPRSNRKLSCFAKNIKDINSVTINAFNHSDRIEKTIQRIKEAVNTITLNEALDEKKIFSTGSFPRIDVKSEKSIMLINQSDIFDTIINGKRISRRKVRVDNLAQYGEVLIAAVGTLGESESFCRAIFVNEDIQDQLISGEFIRMKTNQDIPAGYLFAWLNTDYGFRIIRSTQTGTKLCRPIQRLLLNMPVPILEKEIMNEIHSMVTKAHTLRFQANQKEKLSIQLVEKEIEQWQN